jgi:EspG family
VGEMRQRGVARSWTGLRGPIRLTAQTYGTVWDYYELGVQHAALSARTPLRTGRDRALAEDRAFAELRGIGLLDGDGPHPDLRAALRLIASATEEYYGWIGVSAQRTVSALVAVDGDVALLAVLDGDQVRLRPASVHDPAETVVGLLEPVPAASGTTLNVRASELPGSATGSERDFLESNNPAESDTDLLASLAGQPRTGAGQLNTARRGDDGVRHRDRAGVNYLDVGYRRWAIYRRHGNHGGEWVVVTPATPRLLADKLYELHDGLG